MDRESTSNGQDKRRRRDTAADREAVLAALKAVADEGITQKQAYERSGVPMHVFYEHKRAIAEENKGKVGGKKGSRSRASKKTRKGRKTTIKRLLAKDPAIQEVTITLSADNENLIRALADRYKNEVRNKARELAESELSEELST